MTCHIDKIHNLNKLLPNISIKKNNANNFIIENILSLIRSNIIKNSINNCQNHSNKSNTNFNGLNKYDKDTLHQ